jgi:hypothetical protein
MHHSSWVLALMVTAYFWHAVLEILKDLGFEEWLNKHRWIRHGVFVVSGVLFLVPAIYYGDDLHDVLYPLGVAFDLSVT